MISLLIKVMYFWALHFLSEERREEEIEIRKKSLSTDLSLSFANHVTKKNNFVLWNNKLGHATLSRTKHIKCISELTQPHDVCLTCPITRLPYIWVILMLMLLLNWSISIYGVHILCVHMVNTDFSWPYGWLLKNN